MSNPYAKHLTQAQRNQLQTVGIYLVNLHSNSGWPGAFESTAAFSLSYEEAVEEKSRLEKQNSTDDFRISGPYPLIQLLDNGKISLEKTLSFLMRIQSGEKHQIQPPPLSSKEKMDAEKILVYYVWYEDRFHFGGDRDSYPVSVCLSKVEADQACKKYDRPVGPGSDGYFVEGPFKLSSERRPEVIRTVLEYKAANKSGPILMNQV